MPGESDHNEAPEARHGPRDDRRGSVMYSGASMPGNTERDRRAAMLRGLSFLSGYALGEACWSECAAEVVYMFFHLATRPRPGEFTRRARPLSKQSARRWLADHPRLPGTTSAEDVVFRYAYGAYTTIRVGLDTRALCRDLAAEARAIQWRTLFGFDPKHERPPSADTWQFAMVGAHIAEGAGMRPGCSTREIAAWRSVMQPYPAPRRRLTKAGWSAFYAVTHLVYVLNDYSLHLLPRQRFLPEVKFLREACEVGVADDDVEGTGEAVDALLSLGDTERDPLIVRARQKILQLQNRDGSWGRRSDEPYTRLHKTWVALDGLTRYGRRETIRPRLPVRSARAQSVRTAAPHV